MKPAHEPPLLAFPIVIDPARIARAILAEMDSEECGGEPHATREPPSQSGWFATKSSAADKPERLRKVR